MKKLLASVLIALLVPLSVFSAVTDINRQEIFRIDSDLYRAVKYLYIVQGKALASTSGPWSAAEMDIMLLRLDPSLLDEDEKAVYDWAYSRLNAAPRFDVDEYFGFDTSLTLAIEASAHTDAEHFTTPDFLGGRGDWRGQVPMASLPLETWIGNFVYGSTSLDFGLNRSFAEGFEGRNFVSNILMVPPTGPGDINGSWPFRGIGSLGGRNWNFSIGRERLSWGPGEGGNLMLGEQIPYHNNARFTAFSEKFKYTFSVSSFPHPMNYMKEDGTLDFITDPDNPYHGQTDRLGYSQSRERKGLSMFVGHRIECRILDKVGISVSESIMYQSEDGNIDLMVLSPTVIFHNYYIRGNANSMLSFDIDWSPVRGLSLYGSALIDEFQLPGECDPDGPPSAYGFILGAKGAKALSGGMLYGFIEAAYTDPYLYLRDSGSKECGVWGNTDYVVATPEYGGSSAANYTLDFLGWRYGNDSVVASLALGYEDYGSWHVEGEFTYIADGTYDMTTVWWDDIVPHGKNDPMAPTCEVNEHGTFAPDEEEYEGRNAVAHHLVMSARGGATFFEKLDIWAETNYIAIINHRNRKGAYADDFQFTLGLSWSF